MTMYNAQEWQDRAARARYLLSQQRMNLRVSAEQLRPLSQLAQLYGSLVPYDDDDDDDGIQPLSAEEC